MSSTHFINGLGDNAKPSSKVLRPPGGGNSQLFGDDMPQTPRSVKNHMASNIFGSEQSASVKQNGDSIRRGQKQIDSYTRLFGEPERNYTPAKNHMKSSIPIGGTSTSSSSSSNGTETNGHKNGNGVHHHQNGNGTITSSSASASSSARNGKMENGGGSSSCTSSEYQNGVSKTVNHNYRKMSNTSARTHLPSNRTTAHSKIIENDENNRQKTTSSSPRNIMGDNDSIMQSSRQPNGDILQNGDDVDKLSNIKEDDDTLSIIGNNNNNCKLNMEEQKQEKNQVTQLRSQKSNYTESSLNSVRNMDIDSSNNSKSATTTATTTPSSAATTSSYYGLINFANANVKSPRRDFNTSRNPVTGTGFGDGLNIRIRRGANIRRDGNPVTGEGYKGAEINTSIPSLNGANQVINKNRIPPGGYSSGLW